MMESNFFEALEPRQLLSTTVSVGTGTGFQTIRGMGGIIAKNARNPYAAVSDVNSSYDLTHLSPSHIRVAIPLAAFEPTTAGGNNPTKINWSGFKDTGSTNAEFKQLQQFSKAGYQITASLFDGPNWSVSDPQDRQHRHVDTSKFSYLAEGIGAWLVRARDTYGVKISDISINESNAGYNLSFHSGVFEPFLRVAGPMFAKMGLSYVKWDVGDDGFVTADSFLKPVLGDKTIAQYLGNIAWHSWNLDNNSDSAFNSFVAIAKQYHKEIWATELGYDPLLAKNHPGAFSTFDNAMQDAQIYLRSLKVIHATVMDYWSFTNDFPLVNPSNSSPYPDYYVVKSYQDNLKPGTVIVQANSSDSQVLSIAAKDSKHNHFFAQVINKHSSSTTVNFTGLPNQKLTLTRSASGTNGKVIGTYTPSGGKLTLTFPGNSINTLSGNYTSSSSTAKAAVAMSAGGAKSMFSESSIEPNADKSLTKDLLV